MRVRAKRGMVRHQGVEVVVWRVVRRVWEWERAVSRRGRRVKVLR